MISNRVALLFAYKRVTYLKDAIRILLDCGVSKIYVAIDGPKNEQDGFEQRELLDFLTGLNPHNCEIILWKRRKNLGVAISIISGLDWFFSHEEVGIIIEDDLKFDHAFVDFVFRGLDQYKENKEIWLVSGSNFLEERGDKVQFVNYPMIWGWGTWRSRWTEIRNFIPEMQVNYRGFRFSNIHFFWLIGLLRVRALTIDTWDIPIAYFMRFQKKYCVLPPVNLVSNMGFDHFSTHTSKNEFPLNYPIENFEISPETFATQVPQDCSSNNRFLETAVFHIRSRHYLLILPIMLHAFKDMLFPGREVLEGRFLSEIQFLP